MIVDSHCHLEMYGSNVEMALSDLERNGIIAISLSNGVPSFERTLQIARQCKMVIPGFGINPHNATDVVDDLEIIREYAKRSIILGEIGLDHFFAKEPSTYPLQEDLFTVFLEVAENQDAILSIHSRGADLDVIRMLDSYSISRVVIHGFDQDQSIAQQFTDRGVYLSFGALITERYSDIVPQWEDVREAASQIPEDLILIETDAPGVWIDELPAERLFQVLSTLSALRLQLPRDTQDQVNRNFIRLVDGITEFEEQKSLVQSDIA